MIGRVSLTAAGIVLAVAAVFVLGCSSDDSASDAARSVATTVTGGAQQAGTQVAGGAQSAATQVAGAAGSGGIREVKIEEKDFSFEISDSIRGGLVKLVATNTGKEAHQAQVVRLNDGVTNAQFQAALQNPNPAAVFSLIAFMGGPNAIAAGGSQTVYDNLTPGNYALLCFVEGDDGVPHFAKGMVKTFTVTAPDGTATPPKADATVTLADFSFLGVDSLQAKKLTLEVKNGGPQPHELTVLKLNQGVTVDALKALLSSPNPPSGPPPVDEAGGLGAIANGATGFVEVDLKAGNYAFLCFVPDANTGAPHAALGMIKAIEVK